MLESLFQPSNAMSVIAALADLTIKAGLVLAMAGIATSLTRKRPASVRHAIWLAAVAGILAMPILTAALPSWRVLPPVVALAQAPETPTAWPAPAADPVAPSASSEVAVDPGTSSPQAAPAAEAQAPSALPAPAADPAPALEATGAPASAGADVQIAPSIATDAASATTEASSEAGRLGQIEVPAQSAITTAVSNLWSGLTSLHWSVLLLGVWLLGAMVIMGNHMVGAFGLFLVSRRARPITSDDWQDLADEIGDRLWITRDVTLLKSHVTTMPVTWGGRRPVVLLPSDADAWSDERRRYVLTHEFAHIRRWDCTTQGLAQLACALYWFNPLVWVASRRLRIERERACDDQVLMAGGKASSYAEHLLDIARSLRATLVSPLGAVAMARPSQLEGRVLAILDPDRRRRSFTRGQTVMAMGLAFLLILPVAAMAPQPLESAWTAEPENVETTVVPEEAAEKPGTETAWSASDGLTSDASEDPSDELNPRDAAAKSMIPQVAGRRPQIAAPDTIDARKRKVAEAFMVALGDEDEEIRRQAAHMLGELEDPRAIGALREALRSDPSTEVRRAALWALAEMDSRDILPVMLEQLRVEKDAEARRQIVYMIGEHARRDDREAGQALVAAFNDDDPEVRATAVWGVAEMNYTPALDAVLARTEDPNEEVRERAVWAIAELADNAPTSAATGALVKALASPNANVRQMAAYSLGEIGATSAASALIERIDDQNAEVRQRVIWALGELEVASAVPALRRALKDSNSEVRRMAAYALSEIDTRESLMALGDVVNDPDVQVRRHAIYALGELEDAAAIPVLERAASDSDREVRRAAIHALSELEDDRAASVLVRALKDQDREIRRAAAHGLSELTASSTVLSGLRTALEDSDSEVRRAAIHALGELEDIDAVPALTRAVQDGDVENRRAAVWALAEILEDRPNDAAIDVLTNVLLEDSSDEVRKAAAYALGEMGSPRSIDALRAALEDGNRDVRRAAANALGSINWDSDDEWDDDEWENDDDREDDDWETGNRGDWGEEWISLVGESIGGIAEAALASAEHAVSAVDFDYVFHQIGHSLAEVDIDGLVSEIEVELRLLEGDIQVEMRTAIVDALVGVAAANPGSKESQAAKRALRRMDHAYAKKKLKSLN